MNKNELNEMAKKIEGCVKETPLERIGRKQREIKETQKQRSDFMIESLRKILLKVKGKWTPAYFYLKYFNQLKGDEVDKMMARSKLLALLEELPTIIFNLQFAKAFFGRPWKKNIKELVVQENRLKWLLEYMK